MTRATGLYAVFGSPVSHSLSPAIHTEAFKARGIDAVYGSADVGVAECLAALRGAVATGHGGLSVTTPLKEEMARCVDSLSPLAADLGAVNCVVVSEGRTRGENTDGDGCCDALEAAGARLGGARLGVLGAGGTARAIAVAAAARGSEVHVVNRTADRAEDLVDLVGRSVPGSISRVARAADLAACDVVVNATSVGFGSAVDTPVDASIFSADQVVLDAVYSPMRTVLLASAEDAGATTVDGLWMLVHQAVRQQRLWSGSAPVDVSDGDLASSMRAAAERELARHPR